MPTEATAWRTTLPQLKQEILYALKILTGEGLFEKVLGHISCRIPGTDLCLIMGHIHDKDLTLGELTAEEIIVIDMDGKVIEGDLEPPGEFPIHTEIYKLRPNVQSVIHCHPRLPVILSIAGKEILPVTYRATVFAPKVPIHDDPTQIHSAAKGRAVAETLGSGRAVVLRAHGVACVGNTVKEAAVITLDLNETASMQLQASIVGTPRPIEERYLAGGGFIGGLDAWEHLANSWNYYAKKYGVPVRLEEH